MPMDEYGLLDLGTTVSAIVLIVAEMQSPELSLKKVGDLISQDVSMSAKILQLVNSALFGLPQKIANPQQAAVYVGIETLKSLVLSFHVFSSLEEDAESCGFSLLKMWRHSLRSWCRHKYGQCSSRFRFLLCLLRQGC